MGHVYEVISEVFELLVQYFVLIIELVGTAILVYAIFSAVVSLCRHQKHVRLKLAEGIALALEIKMGAEVLKTVIVSEWKELLILGAIVLLRAAMTFLLHWEVQNERKHGNMTDAELHDIKTPLTQDLPDDGKEKRTRRTAKVSTDEKTEEK